ncbi:hypothetical protein ACOQFV_08865 [Nocardiopsis changdeensis]|uniref:DUF3039 domain-containing protein n=1 Tax=Nocardiopsis changdeensis TaxID=2831969 RepID=A0ABX8BHC2_9ACTN|nr:MULTISPECIES: hypothetical protein [Nocardiopsis]QUX20346.1 hypothetical protein KGD84_17615 [Nocardiopsis changdeensis]QYX36276.1 hypothetical protein K1J57_27070 [Nocardiopsis sp. MT53]
MSRYPHRVRLRGGRNTHAARAYQDITYDLITPCDYVANTQTGDHALPDDAAVNCPRCVRQLNAEDADRSNPHLA